MEQAIKADTWNVYEILTDEAEDDLGRKTKLQYQSGGYTKDEAWKEARRLNRVYQGYYFFTAAEARS